MLSSEMLKFSKKHFSKKNNFVKEKIEFSRIFWEFPVFNMESSKLINNCSTYMSWSYHVLNFFQCFMYKGGSVLPRASLNSRVVALRPAKAQGCRPKN